MGHPHQRQSLATLRLPRPAPVPAAITRPTWPDLIKSGNEDDLRIFHLLFRRDAFTLQHGATTTFLEAALAEGRRYEEQVAKDLSSIVFKSVFPDLVAALADATAGRPLLKPAGAGPLTNPGSRIDLPLQVALCALRRRQGSAACQRLALRRLRLAKRAGRYRTQNRAKRHVLCQGIQLLRPPRQSFQNH